MRKAKTDFRSNMPKMGRGEGWETDSCAQKDSSY